jgi:hypothetical protein
VRARICAETGRREVMQSAVKQSLERGLADTVIFEASTRPGDGYIHITGMCSVVVVEIRLRVRSLVPNPSLPALHAHPSTQHSSAPFAPNNPSDRDKVFAELC